MLQETKTALRKGNTAFDSEILDLIHAGVEDLKITGAVFTTTSAVGDVVINDPLIKRAVITYVRCNFGTPDNYAYLKSSYDEQKAQLRENSNYKESTDGEI